MKERTGNDKYYYEILQLFRLNQKRSAFIGPAYGTAIGIAETFILVEIDLDPARSAKQLSESLALEKSIISRKISFLEKEGFLTRERTEGDARRKKISLTNEAHKFLEIHDEFNNKQIAEQGARITIEELSLLQSYFQLIADGADQPPASLRPGENPLLIEMRRISRAFKIFGTSLADSGYSGLEWQMLSEIALGEEQIRAVDVSKALGLAPTTVSQILSRFSRKGLIERKSDPKDKRNRTLSLTPAGERELDMIDDACLEVFRKSFKKERVQSLKNFIEVFARYIDAPSGGSSSFSLRPEIRVRRLETDSDRKRARGFLVLQLVRQNRYLDIPETLLASSGESYVVESQERVQGVVEFSKAGAKAVVEQFVTSADIEGTAIARGFFKAASLEHLSQSGCKKVELSKVAEFFPWIEELSGAEDKHQSGAVTVVELEKWKA